MNSMLHSSAISIAKWDQIFEDVRLGGREVLEQMFEQGILNNGKEISYAMGLDISEYKGLKTIDHDGYDAGYRSMFLRFPDHKLFNRNN